MPFTAVYAVFKVGETCSIVVLLTVHVCTHCDASPPAPDPPWVWEQFRVEVYLWPVPAGILQEDRNIGGERDFMVSTDPIQRAAGRRTVEQAYPGCTLGNRTAQDLDLSRGVTVPAQQLQPEKPSHRGGEETVENPEVSVSVGPEDLGTIATKLTIYHRTNVVARTSADLLLFAQNILVQLPGFSIFAEINKEGLDVMLGCACCYYAWKKGIFLVNNTVIRIKPATF